MYAHEQIGFNLHIYVTGDNGMHYASLYAPVGEGSIISMRCSATGCVRMNVYDDWTTEIYMEPFGSSSNAFRKTEIKNIFDDSTLNISRSDSNYIGSNTAYRAPVFLNGCHHRSTSAWVELKYYGHNHGD